MHTECINNQTFACKVFPEKSSGWKLPAGPMRSVIQEEPPMFAIISLVLTLTVVYFGYSTARRFVRDRLRFVEGARKPHIPFVVAFAVLAITVPIAALLPFIGV